MDNQLNSWSDERTRRAFFDELGKRLSITHNVYRKRSHRDYFVYIKRLDDWCSIYGRGLTKEIEQFGGSGILHYYGSVGNGI